MFNQFKKQVEKKGYTMERDFEKEYVYWDIVNKKMNSKAILKRYDDHFYMTVDGQFPLELLPLVAEEMTKKALFINYCGHLICTELEKLGFEPLRNRVKDPLFFTFEERRANLYVFEKDRSYIDEKLRYSHPIFQGIFNLSQTYPDLNLQGIYTWKEPIAVPHFRFDYNGQFAYDYGSGKYKLKIRKNGKKRLNEDGTEKDDPDVLEERIYESNTFMNLFKPYV